MRKTDLKKILVNMIKKGESERITKYHNKYTVLYLEGTDEYLIGHNDWDSQILNSITYTDAKTFPASEIDKLAELKD